MRIIFKDIVDMSYIREDIFVVRMYSDQLRKKGNSIRKIEYASRYSFVAIDDIKRK